MDVLIHGLHMAPLTDGRRLLLSRDAQGQPLVLKPDMNQTLGPEQTADTVAEIGWDGIECPVRAKGQVLPERVEEDLPKFVEALRQRPGQQAMEDAGEVEVGEMAEANGFFPAEEDWVADEEE